MLAMSAIWNFRHLHVGLVRQPGKLDSLGTVLNRSNCVLPMVVGDEVAWIVNQGIVTIAHLPAIGA